MFIIPYNKSVFSKIAVMIHPRGGSRTAATSKVECFVIIVNGWKLLTIITKHFILDAAAALYPSLHPVTFTIISHNIPRILMILLCADFIASLS